MADEVVELVRKGFEAEKANDISKAISYYEQAANKGHTGAMLRLGDFYWKMNDLLKSAEWQLKAFMLGDNEAINSLITLHVYAEGHNADAAIKVFAQAFEKTQVLANEIIAKKRQVTYESVTGIFNLGIMYSLGWGTTESKELKNTFLKFAYDFYMVLAGQGDERALSRVAYMTLYGYAVEENRKTAFELYKQAAEADVLEAIYRVGWIYYGGIENYLEEDLINAKNFYKKASNGGYIPAMEAYYEMCKDEEEWELNVNRARTGNPSARYNLAVMYHDGRGVKKDRQKALEILIDLVNEGEDRTSIYEDYPIMDVYGMAAYPLGIFYYEEGDYVKARDLFGRASECGMYEAIKKLSQMYKEGKGGKKDSSHAEYLMEVAREFEDARTMGDISQQYKVAYKYWEGAFVKENQELALAWFQKIANNPHIFGSDMKYKEGARKNIKILCKDLGIDEKSLGLLEERPRVESIDDNYATSSLNSQMEKSNDAVLCPHCQQYVEPKKKFSWIWLLVWTVCTGGPIGFFLYIIYYILKSKKCPLCGEKIKK